MRRIRLDEDTRGVRFIALIAVALAVVSPNSSPASAQSDDATAVVKRMTDYLAAHPDLSSHYDIEFDVITPDLEKIEFAASGAMARSAPNRVHLTRHGGYSDVELIFDGKTTTVVDRFHNKYAQLTGPTSIDQLIGRLRSEYMMDLPGADLFSSNSYRDLMDGVVVAKHVGIGVIDGQECDHLAFRKEDTDWQLWVRTGPRPLPCKYKITSKTLAAAPEYTIRFYNWSETRPPDSEFVFKPAAGAQAVGFDQLSNVGELPSPVPYAQEGKSK
jgi:hypothetical protein